MHWLRHWRNTAYLLWAIKMQRSYLQSILAISEDQQARILAAAALAHTQDDNRRMLDP